MWQFEGINSWAISVSSHHVPYSFWSVSVRDWITSYIQLQYSYLIICLFFIVFNSISLLLVLLSKLHYLRRSWYYSHLCLFWWYSDTVDAKRAQYTIFFYTHCMQPNAEYSVRSRCSSLQHTSCKICNFIGCTWRKSDRLYLSFAGPVSPSKVAVDACSRSKITSKGHVLVFPCICVLDA